MVRILCRDDYQFRSKKHERSKKNNHSEVLFQGTGYLDMIVKQFVLPRVAQGIPLDAIIRHVQEEMPKSKRLLRHIKAMALLELRKTHVSALDDDDDEP